MIIHQYKFKLLLKKISPHLFSLLFPLFSYAEVKLPVKFGGFIDTYYAYDFNNPKSREREFTTQPARHNEFNVNLAYLEAVIDQETSRGRLALQFGTSSEKNTLADEDAKYIQEAFVGKKINSKTWIDGGLFLGHIGMESWISKDNWTYTRALNSDYAPYYSAGVRLEHQIDNAQSVQFLILNGWQRLSEDNSAKSIGMQYQNLLSERLTFSYNNYFGDEKVVPNPETGKFNSRFRGYHNFNLKWLATERWNFLASLDIGLQSQQANSGVDAWGTGSVTIRRMLDAKNAIALRFEYYNDRHQANILTQTNDGFQVLGASINYDHKLEENALWRTELRGFNSKDEIFTRGEKYENQLNGFIATSLSMWF